jgi:hypothetical protein
MVVPPGTFGNWERVPSQIVRLAQTRNLVDQPRPREQLIHYPGHALLEDFIGPPTRPAPMTGGHGCLYLSNRPPQDQRLGSLLRAQSRPPAEQLPAAFADDLF